MSILSSLFFPYYSFFPHLPGFILWGGGGFLPQLLVGGQDLGLMDDLLAKVAFQQDIRDCNILCVTRPSVTPFEFVWHGMDGGGQEGQEWRRLPHGEHSVVERRALWQLDAGIALSGVHDVTQHNHPEAVLIVMGVCNKAKLRRVMPNMHQLISRPTREDRTLGHC